MSCSLVRRGALYFSAASELDFDSGCWNSLDEAISGGRGTKARPDAIAIFRTAEN